MQNTMQAVKAKLSNISIPWRLVLKNVAAIVLSLVALSWLHLRPLGIFFLSLLFYWLYKTRCSFQIVPPPELQKIYQFRKENRTMFDTAMFSVGGFFVVGEHFWTGFSFTLIIVIIAFIIANCIDVQHLQKRRDRRYYEDDANTESGTETGTEAESDDEFLPETSSNNLALLACASDQISYSLQTEEIDDEESDDIPSDLIIHDCIPELNENSTDDDDDLMPVINVDELNAAPRTIASNMRFEKCHFDSDCTSSSEENLSKGLNFTDSASGGGGEKLIAAFLAAASTMPLFANNRNVLPTSQPSSENVTSNNSSKNGALVSAVAEVPKDEDRSSESEFEFLDHE